MESTSAKNKLTKLPTRNADVSYSSTKDEILITWQYYNKQFKCICVAFVVLFVKRWENINGRKDYHKLYMWYFQSFCP